MKLRMLWGRNRDRDRSPGWLWSGGVREPSGRGGPDHVLRVGVDMALLGIWLL